MTVLRHIVYCMTGLLVLSSISGAQDTIQTTARDLFMSVESRFESLRSLQYTVDKTTRTDRETVKERWIFRYRSPSFIRIDYEKPEERVFVLNEEVFWEFIPAVRKAMRTSLARLDSEQKQALIGSVFGRLAIDGLRLGDYREMASRVTKIERTELDNKSTFVVEGDNPRFSLRIDADKKVLLQMEIYDFSGGLKVHTMASDFVEAAPSFWFPQKIEVGYSNQRVSVTCLFVISDIEVNQDIPLTTFDFQPPKGVSITEN